MPGSTRELYLDPLIKVLTNTIYEDPSMRPGVGTFNLFLPF